MTYYLGGYYLIRLRPIDFGSEKGKTAMTCSHCINDSLLESWSYGWTVESKKIEKEVKSDFLINDEAISRIRPWVDKKYEEEKIGWVNVFADLDTAKQYKELFFSHLPDIQIMAIYFNEKDATDLVNEFEPQEKHIGKIGLCQNLKKRVLEPVISNERLLGYDFIGVEIDGGFHSFYCHDITNELIGKLGLTLNSNGLFDHANNWQQIHDYLNDEANGLEPVPWFVAKIKLVTE